MSTEFATRAAIPRNVTSLALETLADTPITVLQGARQVGKSTLATQLVEEVGGRLLSLDSDEVLEAARRDPAWFVRQVDGGTLALDEVQRAPELVRAVKGAVDEDRRPGRFLLTGSSNLLHRATRGCRKLPRGASEIRSAS